MNYYKPCKELDECNRLIKEYFEKGLYKECFEGHLRLAEQGYALAECQVGYFYYEGLGVEKDARKAFYWTERAALHGDRDAQCNLAVLFYLNGVAVEKDFEKAKEWLLKAALQGNDYAIERCNELNIEIPAE
jgi:TPR repeat protein